MYHIFFIHSSINGHLGCFHVSAIVNSAAMDIGVNVSFQIRIFSRYMPRTGIAQSYSNCIFSFLRNLFAILSSKEVGHSNLHSLQQCRGFLFLYPLSSIYMEAINCLMYFSSYMPASGLKISVQNSRTVYS